jgi:type IV secretory pathway VirB6-like protein
MLWAGPFGIAIVILTLFIGFLFISMVGRVVQGYLISIGAITILLYLSPLVMPCMLFPETKGYYNTWLDKIKQYATGIPISLLTIGIMVILTDYIFYGSPAEYDYYSVFNDNGTVNTSCGLIDPANAPLICLFNIMGNAVSSASCLFGTCVSVGDNFWKYIGVLILKSIRAIIILNVIMDSLGKIEDFMGSMLGVSADTTLNGSIFNSSTGLFNQLKARALATMQAPIDMPIDARKKINTARKGMK